MTIDEAIQHCREQVQEQAKKGCYSCAEEHQQLAEWLKELKVYKEQGGDAISRQAVIDVTWEEPSYTDALNVLTEVRDKVKVLPSVTPQQRTGQWIPVSERLPEKTGIYLISIGDLVTSKSFDGHNFRTESAVRFIPDAWMPLPEPYKAESEVQDADSN